MAIDPGPEKSAWVQLENGLPVVGGIEQNDDLLRILRCSGPGEQMAVEMIASYGMAVGKEVFETCVWIGRFIQTWKGDHAKVYRKDVKMHLCGNPRAKDPNIRQALIDRFGGEKAIGTKKAPGPLYGFKADMWAALGVAVTYADTRKKDHGLNPDYPECKPLHDIDLEGC